MPLDRLIHLSAFPGWIACVTHCHLQGYQCWVIDPEYTVLSDGELYPTSAEALAAGRLFIHQSIAAETGREPG